MNNLEIEKLASHVTAITLYQILCESCGEILGQSDYSPYVAGEDAYEKGFRVITTPKREWVFCVDCREPKDEKHYHNPKTPLMLKSVLENLKRSKQEDDRNRINNQIHPGVSSRHSS